MNIKLLKTYNRRLAQETLAKLTDILNADTPGNGDSLVPLFRVANKYIDELTILERRLNFLERMEKNNEKVDDKQ